MIFPTSAGDFDLTDDMMAALALKYPHVAVRDECLKASMWLYRHPAVRPVYPIRYIENWLKKIQAKPQKMRSVGGMTDSDIDAMGRRLGIQSRPGENYQQYLRRLQSAADRPIAA
jgi:hypothetical protein